MAFLGSDVTHDVRMTLSAFYPDSHPDALALVNKAHAKIALACGLYPMEVVNVDLSKDVREYALDSDVFEVLNASYWTAVNRASTLSETCIAQLDRTTPDWRLADSGVPTQYYEEGGNLGLDIPPAATPTGGFPMVRLSVRKRHALSALSDSLPAQAPTIDAWVYQVCLYWCARNDRANVSLFAPLAQGALADLQAYVAQRVKRLDAVSLPATKGK